MLVILGLYDGVRRALRTSKTDLQFFHEPSWFHPLLKLALVTCVTLNNDILTPVDVVALDSKLTHICRLLFLEV